MEVEAKVYEPVKEATFEIEGITLLTEEEYHEARFLVNPCAWSWWLRTPENYDSFGVRVVQSYGGVTGSMSIYKHGVRPALIISNSSGFEVGDKIKLFGLKWTVISRTRILCDSILNEMPFREERFARNASDYEWSDIKAFLENWLDERLAS